MIEIAALTILGALYITFEKPAYVLVTMTLLQVLALLPNNFDAQLNFFYILLMTVLPALCILTLKKKSLPAKAGAKMSDFVVYTSVIIIVSSLYILSGSETLRSFTWQSEYRSSSTDIWGISLLISLLTLGILTRLKKK